MPRSLPLIERPSGNWDDPFERQAIEMSVVHNMFIRGINAIYAQATTIQPSKAKSFAFFCNALLHMIHHHHTLEEDTIFPFHESKFGTNAMEHNIEQHHAFQPGFDVFQAYIKDILDGKAVYSGDLAIEKLDGFSETLVTHLHDEIPTIKSSRFRETCTEADMKILGKLIEERVLKGIKMSTYITLGLSLHDKTYEPRFPDIPKPIIWYSQYVLWHLHSDAWAFSPCDAFGNLKPGFEAKA